MADYVTRFTATDETSGVVEKVKKSVEELNDETSNIGQSATQYNKILKKWEDMQNKSLPLKRQLRDIQQLMAKMNMNGLADTSLYTEMAQKAGEVKDAMDDANASIRAMSSDTSHLAATTQALQGMAGGVAAVTGAMNLFGVESEKVQEIQAKLQAAIAMVNGVTAIANALNKDSALMNAIKAASLQAEMTANLEDAAAITTNTAAEGANAVATGANTVSKTANTVATGLATVAQNAFNTAVAIGKALFGDYSGLVLVGIGALAAGAIAMAAFGGETETVSQKIARAKEEQDKYYESLGKTLLDLRQTLQRLKTEWRQVRNTADARQWIIDNQQEFNKLGIEINDVTDAENVFKNFTNFIKDAFMIRAKAAALAAVAALKYQHALESVTEAEGDFITEQQARDKFGTQWQKYVTETTRSSQQYMGTTSFGMAMYTPVEEKGYKINTEGMQRLYDIALAQVDAEVNTLLDKQIQLQNEAKDKFKAAGVRETGGRPMAGSRNDLANQIAKLQRDLNDGIIPANQVDATRKRIKELQKQVDAIDIANGFKKSTPTITAAKGSLEALEEELSKLQDKQKKGLIPANQVEATNARIKELQDQIRAKKIELNLAPAEGSVQAIENQIRELEQMLQEGHYAPKDLPQLIESLKRLRKAAEDEKIKIGLEPYIAPGSVQAIEKQIQEIEDRLQRGVAEATDQVNLENLRQQLKNERLRIGLDKEPLQYSMEWFNKQISDIDKELNEKPLDLATRLRLEAKKSAIQAEIDKITEGNITIKATVQPTRSTAKGDLFDQRKSRENAEATIRQIMDDYENGIIRTKSQALASIGEVNRELVKLGQKPIVVKIEGDWESFMAGADNAFSVIDGIDGIYNATSNLIDKIDEGANAWEVFIAIVGEVEAILSAINTVMEICNMLTGINTANKIANTAASEAESIATTEQSAIEAASIAPKTAEIAANKALEASILDLAAAGIFAAHAEIPFAGVAIASGMISAMMAAMAAQHAASAALAAFKEGGIVGGSTQEHPILAHRGEMILNEKQQSHLFNMIEQGRATERQATQVVGRIRGTDIELVMSNLKKNKSRAGLTLNIL